MDEVPASTPTQSTDTNDKPTKKERAPKKPGRWKRRLIVLALVLVAIAIIGRVIIVIALPPVMRNVAGRYGLDVEYDRMHLYLLSGDVGFWNLRAVPRDGAASPAARP